MRYIKIILIVIFSLSIITQPVIAKNNEINKISKWESFKKKSNEVFDDTINTTEKILMIPVLIVIFPLMIMSDSRSYEGSTKNPIIKNLCEEEQWLRIDFKGVSKKNNLSKSFFSDKNTIEQNGFFKHFKRVNKNTNLITLHTKDKKINHLQLFTPTTQWYLIKKVEAGDHYILIGTESNNMFETALIKYNDIKNFITYKGLNINIDIKDNDRYYCGYMRRKIIKLEKILKENNDNSTTI